MDFRVPQDTIGAVANYLLERPMREVEALVNALRRCEVITEPVDPTDEDDG